MRNAKSPRLNGTGTTTVGKVSVFARSSISQIRAHELECPYDFDSILNPVCDLGRASYHLKMMLGPFHYLEAFYVGLFLGGNNSAA